MKIGFNRVIWLFLCTLFIICAIMGIIYGNINYELFDSSHEIIETIKVNELSKFLLELGVVTTSIILSPFFIGLIIFVTNVCFNFFSLGIVIFSLIKFYSLKGIIISLFYLIIKIFSYILLGLIFIYLIKLFVVIILKVIKKTTLDFKNLSKIFKKIMIYLLIYVFYNVLLLVISNYISILFSKIV